MTASVLSTINAPEYAWQINDFNMIVDDIFYSDIYGLKHEKVVFHLFSLEKREVSSSTTQFRDICRSFVAYVH